jgi:hypothetical protein
MIEGGPSNTGVDGFSPCSSAR